MIYAILATALSITLFLLGYTHRSSKATQRYRERHKRIKEEVENETKEAHDKIGDIMSNTDAGSSRIKELWSVYSQYRRK